MTDPLSRLRRFLRELKRRNVYKMAGAGIWQFTPLGEGDEGTEAATPRIAVLPFENISHYTGDAVFARGMHEEVLNQLSKISGLDVISRTSVMGYVDTDERVPEISNELGGVNTVLEGTVRRAAGRVRISTTLIKAPEDEDLWSNTYERQLSPQTIFDIEANIAQQIAGALETQLTGDDERRRIEDVPTDDLAAYDAYLQGRNALLDFLGQRDPAQLDRAIGSLRKAIEQDSTFAAAHAWLGRAYGYRGFPQEERRWLDSAAAEVERAQTLDPDLAEAYVAEGFVTTFRGSSSAKIEALRKALKLEPSHAVAKAELSDALRTQGRFTQAIQVAREAVQLDPRNPHVLQEMADQLRAVGFYEPAEAWYRRGLEVEPGHFQNVFGVGLTQMNEDPEESLMIWRKHLEQRTSPPPPVILQVAAEAALRARQPQRAKEYLARIPEASRRLDQDSIQSQPDRRGLARERALLGLAEIQLGRVERGRSLLQQASDSLRADLNREPGEVVPLVRWRKEIQLARVLAALGETDKAVAQLRQSQEAAHRVAEMVLSSPEWFGDLKSDPRFQEIIRDLKARREKIRGEVRQLGIALYPPGAESDSAQAKSGVR